MSIFKDLAIEKTAALKPDVKLYDHQQKAIDSTGNRTIYAHATGSGKTLTGIAKFEKLKEKGEASKALVVVPAGLRKNFLSEGVEKFTDSKGNLVGTKEEIRKGEGFKVNPDADYNIVSYERYRMDPERYIRESGADTIITDESHRGRNDSTVTMKSLRDEAVDKHIKNYIGLTGSITNNTPADVVPLVEVASGGKVDLGTKRNFMDTFAERSNSKKYKGLHQNRIPITGFKHKNFLKSELSPYVHYLGHDDIKDTADFPDKDLEVIKVPISRKQAKMYKAMLKEDPALRKMIIKKRMDTLKDDELARSYNQLYEMRKMMNDPESVTGKDIGSPKLDRIMSDLKGHLGENEDGQAIILSHMIDGGINSIEDRLKSEGIEYGKFIGKGNNGVTEKSRQKDVEDYKNRLKRVMLISSAGGEGISLGDTTFEAVMDPHYNPEKMEQMEARGVRAGGLKHRPDEDRAVDVNRYIATMPKTLGIFKSRYQTPDEAILDIAKLKAQQNSYMHDLLREIREDKEKELTKAEKGSWLSRVFDRGEEKAASIHDLAIEKTASIAKLRKKRYWQMLKRLHGGTNTAISNIKMSGGDTGIYHGTDPSNVKSILSSGLKRKGSRPDGLDELGRGIYFGKRDVASGYGNLVRLKKPSELTGKQMYPSASKFSATERLKVNPRKTSQEMRKLKAFGPGDAYFDKVRLSGNQRLSDIHPNMLTPSSVAKATGNAHDLARTHTVKKYNDPVFGIEEIMTPKRMPLYRGATVFKGKSISPDLLKKASIKGIAIEKTAMASKVQKMYNAGKLSAVGQVKATLTKPSSVSQIHHKINSKAKRLDSIANQVGRKIRKMDAEKYKRLSKTDNIRNVAPIDTSRTRKYFGKKVNETIKNVRDSGYRVDVNKVDDRFSTALMQSGSTGEIYYAVNGPKKGFKSPWIKGELASYGLSENISPEVMKTIRKNVNSKIWAHEGAHELGEMAAHTEWLRRRGRTTNGSLIGSVMDYGTHQSPRVLSRDTDVMRGMDIFSSGIFEKMRARSSSHYSDKSGRLSEVDGLSALIGKNKGKSMKSLRLTPKEEVNLNKRVAEMMGLIDASEAEGATRFSQKINKNRKPLPEKILLSGPVSKK